jgi:hypothetical protein
MSYINLQWVVVTNKGPYQVIGHEQSIYVIKDLIKGKQIRTHIQPAPLNL